MWKAASGEAALAAEEGRPGIMRGVFGVGLGTARGWGGASTQGCLCLCECSRECYRPEWKEAKGPAISSLHRSLPRT